MKRRFLTAFLALCMIVSVFPVAALATDDAVFIGQTGYSSLGNAITAASDGAVIEIHRDVELSSALSINKSVSIVPVGNVTVKAKSNSGYITVAADKTVTFGYAAPDATQAAYTLTVDGGAVWANGKLLNNSNGEANTAAPTINSNSGIEFYNTAMLRIFGSLTMHDGVSIANAYTESTNNTGSVDGSIHIGKTGSFTMEGGTIHDCYSNHRGGGVYVAGTFTMNGGSVSCCAVPLGGDEGGGVCIDDNAKFYMNGGSIDHNFGKNGGGISACANAKNITLKISGGTITANSTSCSNGQGGGAIHIQAYSADSCGSISIKSADADNPVSITNNWAGTSSGQCHGGGLYLWDAKAELEDVVISGNVSGFMGGGLFLRASQITLNNCVIQNNTAQSTGGIYSHQSNLTLNHTEMKGNSSTVQYGGGIQAYAGTATINDSTIQGNTAAQYGGGVLINGTTASIDHSVITENFALGGGGIYAAGTTTITDSIIDNNTASAEQGGGIAVDGSTVTLKGTTSVSGNIAGATTRADISGDGIAVNGALNVQDDVFIDPDNDVYLESGKFINVSGKFTGATEQFPIAITSKDYVVETSNTTEGTKLVAYSTAAGGEDSAETADLNHYYTPSKYMSKNLVIGESEVVTTDMTYIPQDGRQVEFFWNYTNADGADMGRYDVWEGKSGEKPICPATDPTRYGYQFDGWYQETSGTNVFDFDAAITENDVAYAKWTELPKHTLTYETNGGMAIAAEEYPEGEEVALTKTPTRPGYRFTGWYKDSALGEKITAVTMSADTTVYAGWEAGGAGGRGGMDFYILHYEVNGGAAIPDERHMPDDEVKLDKRTTREGYRFTGWYADAALTEPVSELQMTENKTVYAGWSESTVPAMLNGDEHFAYVVGYPDDTVRPEADISRAETAVIFFRLLKSDVRERALTDMNGFDDVAAGAWYNRAVSTLAALGIVEGRSTTAFCPDAPITRAEFAAICARFDTGLTESIEPFTDISGHWAEREIEHAASLGWVRGYADGTFQPDRHITRAEAMTMINRVLCRVPGSADDLLDDMNRWPDNRPDAWYYLAVQEASNSHDFQYRGEIYERWTAMTEDPDWTRYQN